MTPAPDRAPAPQRGPSVVGLVHGDLGRLRERLTMLEQRPDLLAEVADQCDVAPTARDVAAAAQDLVDRLLDRLYERADPDADAIAGVSRAADAPGARLRAGTAQQVRAQGSRPAPPGVQMRR